MGTLQLWQVDQLDTRSRPLHCKLVSEKEESLVQTIVCLWCNFSTSLKKIGILI